MENPVSDPIRQSVLCLLEETLHSHQGVYLSPRTSLIETLQDIDADLASREYAGLKETIAGHVNHATYYLINTVEMLQGKSDGSFDVVKSWSTRIVGPHDWNAVRSDLERAYGKVMALVSSATESELTSALPALFGLFAHSAYHLGAIRQLKDLS